MWTWKPATVYNSRQPSQIFSWLCFHWLGTGSGQAAKTLPFTRLGSFKPKTVYDHNWMVLHIPTTRDIQRLSSSLVCFNFSFKELFERLLLDAAKELNDFSRGETNKSLPIWDN